MTQDLNMTSLDSIELPDIADWNTHHFDIMQDLIHQREMLQRLHRQVMSMHFEITLAGVKWLEIHKNILETEKFVKELQLEMEQVQQPQLLPLTLEEK